MNGFKAQNNVLYFGHRGCRGLYPENTIEGFKKAIELGVDGIEWDIVINKDHEIIISHEPFIDTNYCCYSNGKEIKHLEIKELNIYKMNTNQIKKFDCGLKFNKNFPIQKKIKESKPSFTEAEIEFKDYKGMILFEIKSKKEEINQFYPDAKDYAKIIYENVKKSVIFDQLIFMSFDENVINELCKLLPNSRFIYLLDDPVLSYKEIIKNLSFKPFALGINFKIANKEIINKAHKDATKVYAWTVNKQEDKKKLIKIGIDGIITDYPNLLIDR